MELFGFFGFAGKPKKPTKPLDLLFFQKTQQNQWFFLFSNSLVSDKSYAKQKILKNFFNNKTLFLILFIIFSFGWNPKTVITGDIASFPGYRIPVKIINYFSSGYF